MTLDPATSNSPASELCDLGAIEQRGLLARGEVSAVELLESHLCRVEEANPGLNAIVALRPDIGTERAMAVDAAIARGEDPGRLAGLVVAHKDLTETAGIVTTYGTPSRRNYVPSADSHLVSRMRAAGAVCIGKTNVPEFGAGSHTFNNVYGLTRNAWDPDRSAGGSSGGAAVALATAMIAIADGSDQGGSLRNPAAWSGVVGFRSTPGVVPRVAGNVWNPNAVSGPMARDVDDLALVLSVMNAPDAHDPMWCAVNCSTPIRPLGNAKVAWSDDLGGLPVEPAITAALDKARTVVESLGWDVEDDEPDLSSADAVFETLRSWRQPGALAPFVEQMDTIKQTVRDEYEAGMTLSGHEVDGALVELGEIRGRVLEFFSRWDLLCAPVTQVEPFPVEWEYPSQVGGREMGSYVEWMRSCSRVTVMGAPALSLPIGFARSGLPVGLQVIGKPGDDFKVLAAAKAIEIAIGPLARPPRRN